jgi:hypothetical protein
VHRRDVVAPARRAYVCDVYAIFGDVVARERERRTARGDDV